MAEIYVCMKEMQGVNPSVFKRIDEKMQMLFIGRREGEKDAW